MQTPTQTLATTLLVTPERFSYSERKFLVHIKKMKTPLSPRQEGWLMLLSVRLFTETVEAAPGHSSVIHRRIKGGVIC